MSFPTLPGFQTIGVAVQATITAYNATTTDFSFTVGGTGYSATWSTDVVANVINTISRTVGSNGRLNLRAAKASGLRLTGTQSAGSNYGGTDFQTYSAYGATVRSVSGNNVTLNVGGKDVTVDWTNPGEIWTGAETTITPSLGSSGTARIGDAFGRSQGLGGPDKWPATLTRGALAHVRVLCAGPMGHVHALDSSDLPVRDSRGNVGTWQLPASVQGFDPQNPAPQTVAIPHGLRAQLGIP